MTHNKESHKKEYFYNKAKKEGYRARSVFKLIDIQNKFNVFKRAFYILDLGSAPGSWLQISKKYAEENIEKYQDQFYHLDYYKIMGVDIKKIAPIENINIIKADFTSIDFQESIEEYFGKKLDLILSDASINKSGNKFTDHIKQLALCNEILLIVRKYLKYKGNAVIKVFQGSDLVEFTKKVRLMFRYLKSYKPKSSNKKSNELYLIGLQKK
ncbi:MAG: SAM-dependent methyltransferase [Promethearchaeota archaeon]